jgi:hypothetical protein
MSEKPRLMASPAIPPGLLIRALWKSAWSAIVHWKSGGKTVLKNIGLWFQQRERREEKIPQNVGGSQLPVPAEGERTGGVEC